LLEVTEEYDIELLKISRDEIFVELEDEFKRGFNLKDKLRSIESSDSQVGLRIAKRGFAGFLSGLAGKIRKVDTERGCVLPLCIGGCGKHVDRSHTCLICKKNI
jgi:hypothetical protein